MSASLKKKVNGQFVEVGASREPVFRGEWELDSILTTINFESGALSSPMAPAVLGAGQLLFPFVAPSGSPFAKSLFLRLDNANLANKAGVAIDLAGLANVSRVGYTAMGSPRTNHSYGAQLAHQGYLNGTNAWPPKTITFEWTDYSIPADSGDVVTISVDGLFGGSLGRTEMGIYIHKVQIFGRAEPYRVGQFVTYAGKMWKTEIDNNTTTPGADATWTESLALLNPSGTTAERPDPVTAGPGFYYYDETISRPIWSNGTDWTDSAGSPI